MRNWKSSKKNGRSIKSRSLMKSLTLSRPSRTNELSTLTNKRRSRSWRGNSSKHWSTLSTKRKYLFTWRWNTTACQRTSPERPISKESTILWVDWRARMVKSSQFWLRSGRSRGRRRNSCRTSGKLTRKLRTWCLKTHLKTQLLSQSTRKFKILRAHSIHLLPGSKKKIRWRPSSVTLRTRWMTSALSTKTWSRSTSWRVSCKASKTKTRCCNRSCQSEQDLTQII